MLNRGDAVVYKCRGLYKVEDIGTLDFSFADRKKKYYTLQSVEDERDRAYVPTDDESNIRKPVSKEEALNKIATLTGGRAAEEFIFHSITTGASNDIEQATKLARAMITRYGMSDQFGMVALETVTNQYLGGDTSMVCSPETAKAIDDEVIATVKQQYEKAMGILKDHAAKLTELAEYLLERETITGEEFMEILQR